MSEIYQVSPHAVDIDEFYIPWSDVAEQKRRLESEGQIEPIEILPDFAPDRLVPDPEGWFYAPAQVAAARELGWDTILVTY